MAYGDYTTADLVPLTDEGGYVYAYRTPDGEARIDKDTYEQVAQQEWRASLERPGHLLISGPGYGGDAGWNVGGYATPETAAWFGYPSPEAFIQAIQGPGQFVTENGYRYYKPTSGVVNPFPAYAPKDNSFGEWLGLMGLGMGLGTFLTGSGPLSGVFGGEALGGGSGAGQAAGGISGALTPAEIAAINAASAATGVASPAISTIAAEAAAAGLTAEQIVSQLVSKGVTEEVAKKAAQSALSSTLGSAATNALINGAVNAVAGALVSKASGVGGAGDANATAAQDALSRQMAILEAQYKHWTDNFKPIEEKLAAEASTFGSPAEQEKAAGRARADVAQSFGNQREQWRRMIGSYGINPNSGRFGSMGLKSNLAEAKTSAWAENTAREREKTLGFGKKMDVLNVGRGIPGSVTAGLATSGALNASMANNEFNRARLTAADARAGLAPLVSGATNLLTSWFNPPTTGTTNGVSNKGFADFTNTIRSLGITDPVNVDWGV